MTSTRRHLSAFAALALTAMVLPLTATSVAAESGATVPAGFRDELVWGNLPDKPMVVSFAPSGKVFVAFKGGVISEYDSLTDTSGTQLTNLAAEVHNYWDRGLMGMVVDPQFPTRPYVYALYAYNHMLGDPAGKKWPSGTACPSPPGGNTDGCTISGKLVRLTTNAAGTSVTDTDTLIEDWCQQFPSHSLGTLAFGPEGALYVTGGDGASFNGPDYGQLGGTQGSPPPTPVNPCGDPANEGGALRAQDIRTTSDPLSLDGSLLRINPDTGAAWPDNANFGSGSANAQKIIAYGLRNPFRMTIRGNGSVWLGDVGFTHWEEIDTVPDPDAAPRNFGWPCREGNGATPEYAGLGLGMCSSPPSLAGPAFTYAHDDTVTDDDCGTGSSSISGISFRTTAGNYPTKYDNGLFFADYTRRCIWFAPASSATANPDFTSVEEFANLRRSSETDGGAVWVGTTPAGDIIYTDYDRNEVRAIHYYPALPPNAAFTATPASGPAPLTVDFDASSSNDPNGDPMVFHWDLDGDGQFDDDDGATISHTFNTVGNVTVGLQVTAGGDTDTAFKTINVGNSPPVPVIDGPSASLTWAVGDPLAFTGHATDLQDGTLAASKFTWTLAIEHCPSNCHEHIIQSLTGVTHGTFSAPDHDYPSYVRIYLKVTDSGGLSTTVHRDFQPKTGTIDAVSSPAGITLGVGSGSGAPPPAATGIVKSHITVTAPASQTFGEDIYSFSKWSDNGARNHAALVSSGATHLTATYTKTAGDASNTCSGASTVTPSTTWRTGRLSNATDVDWYRFSLTSTATMRIVLGNLPEDASLSLYSGCSKLLVTADRADTLTEEIFKSLPKGSYAVKVTTKGVPSDELYSLSIRKLSAGLTFISGAARVQDGSLVIVGEVYNGTSASQAPAFITAKLYDASGHLLATRTGRTDSFLPKGGRMPYRIVGSVPAGYARTVVSIRGVSTTSKLVAQTLSGLTSSYDDSRFRVQGTVKSSVALTTYRVMMTTYNRLGTVVDVTRGGVGIGTLGAGQSTTFDAWSSYAGTIDKAAIRSVGVRK